MAAVPRSERGLDRLVNFSDAVVAIAITLLVLPLTDLVSEAAGQGAFTIVADHRDQFAAFVLTFLVTAIFWFRHHSMFERVACYDAALMRLNMLWLMFIVLLPFASGLVGEFGFRNGNGVFYAGNLTVLSLLLAVMGAYLGRRPGLLRAGVSATSLRTGRGWIYTGFFAVIALISLGWPALASWLLLLLFPLGWLTRRRDEGGIPSASG